MRNSVATISLRLRQGHAPRRDRALVPGEAGDDRIARNARTRKIRPRAAARNGHPTSSDPPNRSSHCGLERNRNWQREEINESLRVLWVVAGHAEARQAGAVERIRRVA